MSLFCRHSRMTANCPICSKELEAELKAKAPPRPGRARAATGGARRASAPGARRSRMVTHKVARAVDDGYRNPLAPGLRATADAERLAAALWQAQVRLAPPGPHPAVAAETDREEATWLAFLLALAPPELHEALIVGRPSWAGGEPPELPGVNPETITSYRAWAERAGSQAAAFEGEADWTPERRFGRVFERLALPGLGRAKRFELLVTLGSAGLYPLEADSLHLGGEDDATSVAAKRLLVSGDRLLLDRRARELAAAAELSVGALDHGLALWGDSEIVVDGDAALPAALRGALALP